MVLIARLFDVNDQGDAFFSSPSPLFFLFSYEDEIPPFFFFLPPSQEEISPSSIELREEIGI